ncbi:hypothetical protein Bbelb_157390 [Branchiostoma belcheri]|nr:hypothetical protein Bbelb_157390 [Branchiostoma belcheri]
MDPNPMYTNNTTNAVNDVNPNPIYRQNNTKPNDPNKGADLPCNQSPTDTHQQGDEAAFGPSDNDANRCLQPYAVTLQQDVQTASIVMPEDNENNPCSKPDTVTHGENEGPILGPVDCGDSQEDDDCGSTLHITRDNEGHPCIQPDAVTHHEHDRIAIESGNCGVVEPCAVQYEEDKTFGESANDDRNPCIQPYAVTHQEDQEPPNNCDGGQPYAIRHHKHDDSGRETVSIASDDEDIQPYAAAYMYECDMYECDKTSREAQTSLPSQNQNQPKAASNSINDVSTSPSSNDVLHALDPNPTYAAADMCQSDVGWKTNSGGTQGSLSSQSQPAAASNSINDANDVLHALNPNPMYMPNVQHPTTCGRTPRLVCLATAVVLGLCIVGGAILLFYLSTSSPQVWNVHRHVSDPHLGPHSWKPLEDLFEFPDGSTFCMRNVHRHAECPQACGMSTGISLTHIYAHIPGTLKTCLPQMVLLSVTPGLVHYALRGGSPTPHKWKYQLVLDLKLSHDTSIYLYMTILLYSSESWAMSAAQNKKLDEKITFGGRGRDAAGKFLSISGVAVSADSEIFVTDFGNQLVQVFSMNGAYLRLFPTRVPGESRKMQRMHPSSVAFDVDPGYLWVLGSVATRHGGGDSGTIHGYMYVVQYSTEGQPRKKFNPWFTTLSRDDRIRKPGVIAMDTRNNQVIVGEGDTIRLFHRNGTLYRCFKGLNNYKARRTGIGGIALDKKGNILLTDGHESIKTYSPSGVKICEFGTIGGAKGRLRFPVGVCVDTSGHIIVANSGHNRVDMFTSQGEFVRTIVGMKKPGAIAMGPDGQLVVTCTDTVTIFPRRMVFA